MNLDDSALTPDTVRDAMVWLLQDEVIQNLPQDLSPDQLKLLRDISERLSPKHDNHKSQMFGRLCGLKTLDLPPALKELLKSTGNKCETLHKMTNLKVSPWVTDNPSKSSVALLVAQSIKIDKISKSTPESLVLKLFMSHLVGQWGTTMFGKISMRGAREKLLFQYLDDNVQALQPIHRKAVGLPTKSTKATEACQIAMQQMVIGNNIIDLASCFDGAGCLFFLRNGLDKQQCLTKWAKGGKQREKMIEHIKRLGIEEKMQHYKANDAAKEILEKYENHYFFVERQASVYEEPDGRVLPDDSPESENGGSEFEEGD